MVVVGLFARYALIRWPAVHIYPTQPRDVVVVVGLAFTLRLLI